MIRPTLGIAIAALVQTLVLAGMIAERQWVLNTGTEVVLETVPIDPRSLFRGDYVILQYKGISRIPVKLQYKGIYRGYRYEILATEPLAEGDRVFVLLQRGDPFWTFVSVHTKRPATLPDQVVVTGRVRELGSPYSIVRYGIESYFIPEGEGRAIEQPAPGEQISVLVAVDRFGNAAIKAVLVDGKPRYEEKLF